MHDRGDPAGHDGQYLIPHLVPEAVVDRLEVVEIAQAQRHRVARRGGVSQRPAEGLLQQRPIGQAGETVVQRLVSQVVLQQLLRQQGTLEGPAALGKLGILPADLTEQPADPEQHQREHDHRGRREHGQVDRQAGQPADEHDDRRDQRRDGHQHHGRGLLPGGLIAPDHRDADRGMQGGRRHQHVGQQESGVDHGVLRAAAVEQLQIVAEVGDQRAADGSQQQPVRGTPGHPPQHSPGDHPQHAEVHHRIGHGHQLARGAGTVPGGDRRDDRRTHQVVPEQTRRADGYGGGVDPTGPPAARRAGQAQHPGEQERISGQVEHIGEGRMGRWDPQHQFVDVQHNIAGDVAGGGCRDQVPAAARGHPVQPHPDDDGSSGAQSDRAVDDISAERGRQQIVETDAEGTGAEDDLPEVLPDRRACGPGGQGTVDRRRSAGRRATL